LLGADNDFAEFLALFMATDPGTGDTSLMRDGSIYVSGLIEMVRLHARRRTTHVLLTGMNENWGAFSTYVPHRTVDWGLWEDHLAEARCTPEEVRQYLDDPATRAVVTPHHTAFWHRKIVSLPVGISTRFMETLQRTSLADLIAAPRGEAQELLINNSGWQHRHAVNQRVIANFDGRVSNTFGLPENDFVAEVLRSRFVLCPSGLGWDTSRIWETLTLGSIPIVEYSDGWHTVLDELPVLFVTNFEEVTPPLLAAAYPEILSRCERFDYGKLTKAWWVSRITALLDGPPRA
jgi:hypothetical protein